MNEPMNLQRIRSFLPVGNTQARMLILGSMPGKASLVANQYYAHPRNQFWLIMGRLFGASPSLPYEKRLKKLEEAKVTLWDSLHSCVRSDSLDSSITEERPNDLDGFLKDHQHITHIYFNGAKAEHSFRKYILPDLDRPDLILQKLPSTSPAHAGMNLETKAKAWEDALMQVRSI